MSRVPLLPKFHRLKQVTQQNSSSASAGEPQTDHTLAPAMLKIERELGSVLSRVSFMVMISFMPLTMYLESPMVVQWGGALGPLPSSSRPALHSWGYQNKISSEERAVHVHMPAHAHTQT